MDDTEVATESSQKFYDMFQQESRALHTQIDRLSDSALSPKERSDETDRCLSGIASLSSRVNKASVYIPAYDQRTYSQAIKALQTRLQQTRAASAPKQKFTFKSSRKTGSVAAEPQLARQDGNHDAAASPAASSSAVNSLTNRKPSNHEHHQLQSTPQQPPQTLTISSRQNTHIVRPTFVEPHQHQQQHPSTATLRDLHHCIVDFHTTSTSTNQTPPTQPPLASLTLKAISSSLLLLAPRVGGPVHLTALHNTVLVVACAQFRMHDCRACDVYLACTSRPIVEGCTAVRFAPLPRAFALAVGVASFAGEDASFAAEENGVESGGGGEEQEMEAEERGAGLWDQVDDFAWLVEGRQSPNWGVLPRGERVTDGTWRRLRAELAAAAAAGGSGDVGAVLRSVGIGEEDSEMA